MNDAQSEADSHRDGANHCAPHKVALMHLTQQREHQQPRSGDRNQDPSGRDLGPVARRRMRILRVHQGRAAAGSIAA